jgi:hypothetical protein
MAAKQYDTALRSPTRQRLHELEQADLLVGIPCFNNEATLTHVMEMVSLGLDQHYSDRPAVILIADGGSTDDTRERAEAYELLPAQNKVVTIYRGIAGKGSALRAIFEAADLLRVRACACLDADLRSITPDWVKYLLEPVLSGNYEFVAPLYSRHKYDGTITNNIVHNLTWALYGKRIRQPIGGDFAFSRSLAHFYASQPVWHTDVAKFGIDIWMTLNAIAQQARIAQVNLGAKVHDPKDPAEALGPMFQQVCGTLFAQLEQQASFWMQVKGSEPIPTLGMTEMIEPEPIAVNQAQMMIKFQAGLSQFASDYQQVFSAPVLAALQASSNLSLTEFQFSAEIWTKLLYEAIAAYHHLESSDRRQQLLRMITPLYLGRVASFINQTRDLDSHQAEQVIAELASICEQQKPYLLSLWQR